LQFGFDALSVKWVINRVFGRVASCRSVGTSGRQTPPGSWIVAEFCCSITSDYMHISNHGENPAVPTPERQAHSVTRGLQE
jgi:hypothetical protein